MMTNTVVDQLILKTIDIASDKLQNQDIPNAEEINAKIVENVLDVFAKHEYLGYFPHYETTKAAITICADNQEQLSQLIRILSDKLLIKMDISCFEALSRQLPNV